MLKQRSPVAGTRRWHGTFKWLFLLALLCSLLPSAQAAETRVLQMGVFPYLSTRALLDLYEPVRLYLAQEMGRPVNLFTASGFKAYAVRTQRSDFDILITPPHFARLAQREAGYLPLAMYTRELRGIVVVPMLASIRNLQDLQGKRIATPARLALVSMVGRKMLRDNGLSAELGLQIQSTSSHYNAVLALQRGEVDAAITENSALAQMPAELRSGVRIVAQTSAMPHVMYLVHPRLGLETIEHLKAALLKFPETAVGRKFLQDSGSEGLRLTREADLKVMEPYSQELKRLLSSEP